MTKKKKSGRTKKKRSGRTCFQCGNAPLRKEQEHCNCGGRFFHRRRPTIHAPASAKAWVRLQKVFLREVYAMPAARKQPRETLPTWLEEHVGVADSRAWDSLLNAMGFRGKQLHEHEIDTCGVLL